MLRIVSDNLALERLTLEVTKHLASNILLRMVAQVLDELVAHGRFHTRLYVKRAAPIQLHSARL